MKHQALEQLQSPFIFSNFINSDDSLDCQSYQITSESEDRIFSPKKLWQTNKNKFYQNLNQSNRKYTDETDITSSYEEELSQQEILEKSEKEENQIPGMAFMLERIFQSNDDNLSYGKSQMENKLKYNNEQRQSFIGFENDFKDLFNEKKHISLERQLKIQRRRKIRRAHNKIKAKVKKLAKQWIQKTELFPNVFRLSYDKSKKESQESWEYQDFSNKFVLPDKEK